MPPDGLLASRKAQEEGRVLFAAHCAICHGVDADGRGARHEGMAPPPADLTVQPWSEEANAGRTFLVIRNGVPQTAMPAWPMFSDREVWDVAAYIVSRKARRKGSAMSAHSTR
jgi:mono/diheme cytochrome c family protein